MDCRPITLPLLNMKLLIRNLDRNISEPTLRAMFESHGAVQSCDLVMDKVTQGSKGFGFVEMPDADEAKAAIQALNASEHGNKRIRVKEAEASKAPPKKMPSKDKPERIARAEEIWGRKKKKS